jgi:hypothetical protein
MEPVSKHIVRGNRDGFLEFYQLFELVSLQVLLKDNMDIVVILCGLDAVVNSVESETHIIYIKIAVAYEFPVYDLHGTSFIIVPSPVDDKEIPPGEHEFIGRLFGTFIIVARSLFPAASPSADPDLVMEALAGSIVQSSESLAKLIFFGE